MSGSEDTILLNFLCVSLFVWLSVVVHMFVCKAQNSSTEFMREQRVRTEYSKDAVGNSQVEGFSRVMTPQIAFLPNLFFSSTNPSPCLWSKHQKEV